MYYVYVLKSIKDGRYYIGATANIVDRLRRHNAGETKSTKPYLPYKVIYTESFSNLSNARKRETEIKKHKSRKYIDNLIES